MSFRQKVLKTAYPAFLWWTRLTGKNTKILMNTNVTPAVSLYTLSDSLIDGSIFSFENLRGKKILLVNTASDCGYTNQYEALEQLYEENKDSLIIIGFPANDFKEQEKGGNETIAAFCKKNYGVNFLLMQKSIVIKSVHQNQIFKWLTDAQLNGWNNQAPTWNFCKYLVDENGRLTHFFGSSISPLGNEIKNAIKNK